MQEQLDGSNKDESEDEQRPRQDNRVGPDVGRERNSCNVEPESCNRCDRQDVYQDHPQGKTSRFYRTAPAELDHQNCGEDQTCGGAGQPPHGCVGYMNEVEKCGNHRESGDQKATFNVEADEAKMPIGKLASERAAEGNHHGRKSDKRQRERCKTRKVVRFSRCHDRRPISWKSNAIDSRDAFASR